MITLREMSMLSTLYAQPHRHYHNINHINDCLVELENFYVDQFTYNDRMVVEKAIWYHDAVYNPYSKENEVQSANLLPPNPFGSVDKLAYRAILATAKHLTTQENLPLATQVMLDIDLSGFGKPFEICWKHAENIRKEYYHTNDIDFFKGRIDFLTTISQRESLYYTDFFKEKYHEQSRRNLEQELEKTKFQIWNNRGYL